MSENERLQAEVGEYKAALQYAYGELAKAKEQRDALAGEIAKLRDAVTVMAFPMDSWDSGWNSAAKHVEKFLASAERLLASLEGR